MVHSHGAPTGAAAAFMTRPTTVPSASTPKSSSFHSPEGRLAEARLRTNITTQVYDARCAALLDHHVGALLEEPGQVEAECFGGLEVNRQVELSRLHDRQFRRFRPFENFSSIGASQPPRVRDAGTVAHQAALSDVLAGRINCRDMILGRQCDELFGALKEDRIRPNKEHPGAVLDDGREG